MDRSALDAAYVAALQYFERVATRQVGASADANTLRGALGGLLPERGEPAARVVEELARKADPGIVASAGPRFFGFVIGGSLPAAVAADWLATAWDQNAGLFVLSPAAAIACRIRKRVGSARALVILITCCWSIGLSIDA